ncbi:MULTISPECIES: alpha/beta hydrolase [Microbacterium]|uniref:RBBP9/YdeN family alpha/beta hydrolase n=1 Tax=Microbacterium TaxID=33882 RepID=UPI001C92CF33|nr:MULTISPECIES: alpha/beta hydrolase [Microbacterium]
MIGYVMVPGIGGSDDAHWQTRWERRWGDEIAVCVEPSSWSQPDLGDWVAAIDRAAADLEPRVDDIVLIAHSLGCWAVAEWLRPSAGRPPRGVLLVAPPDPTGDAFPAAEAPSFTRLDVRSLPCPSVVVASTNDPYCDLGTAEGLARGWGSEFVVVGDLGHLNSASGLGDWPQGREALHRAFADD